MINIMRMSKQLQGNNKTKENILTTSKHKNSSNGLRWGWVVVFGSFMMHLIVFGVSYSCGFFYIEFQEEFKEDKGKIALIGTLAPGITHVIGPFVSSLSVRFGYRTIAIVGAIVSAVGFGMSTFATSIYHLYITMGVLPGIGMGMMYVPAIVVVNLYFTVRRSFAVGLAVCGAGVGTFVFAIFTTYMINIYEWRGTALIDAGILLNCVLCGALYRPINRKWELITHKSIAENNKCSSNENATTAPLLQNYCKNEIYSNVENADEKFTKPSNKITYGHSCDCSTAKPCHFDNCPTSMQIECFMSRELNVSEDGDRRCSRGYNHDFNTTIYETKHSKRSQTLCPRRGCSIPQILDFSLLRNSAFILICCSNVCSYFGYITPALLLPHHAQNKEKSPEIGALLVSAVGISNTVGRVVFGLVADRPSVNRLVLYIVSLLMCGLATLCIPFYSRTEYLFCCASVFGLFSGSCVCLISVILVDIFGIEKLNFGFGVVTMANGVGLLMGPPIQGALYEISGTYDVSFYVTGFVGILSGVILLAIPIIRKYTGKDFHLSTVEIEMDVQEQESH